MGGGKGSICISEVWDQSTQGQAEEEKDTPKDRSWTRGNRPSGGPMPIAKEKSKESDWETLKAICVKCLINMSFHPGISLLGFHLKKISETVCKLETTRCLIIGGLLNTLRYMYMTKCYVAASRHPLKNVK